MPRWKGAAGFWLFPRRPCHGPFALTARVEREPEVGRRQPSDRLFSELVFLMECLLIKGSFTCL